MRILLVPAVAVLLCGGCSADPEAPQKEITKTDTTASKDTGNIFVFPAPLQVATWVHQYGGPAEMELLAPYPKTGFQSATDYSRSLNLGILLTDIGYASLFNQRQATLDKLAIAEQLLNELHLGNIAAPLIPRLKNNIENPDSLSFLVLTLYDNAHKALNKDGREKIAFYVTSGSYLEGLAITLTSETIRRKDGFSQLLAQQKTWLTNLQDAVTYFPEDADTQDLYNTFYTLQHYFAPVNVEMKGNVPVCVFTEEQLAPLAAKAVQLRNDAAKS
jgi:hypothetical protein